MGICGRLLALRSGICGTILVSILHHLIMLLLSWSVFGIVYSLPASNAEGITRQYFILSSFTVCCCFVCHIIRFVLCLLRNEDVAYCLLKSLIFLRDNVFFFPQAPTKWSSSPPWWGPFWKSHWCQSPSWGKLLFLSSLIWCSVNTTLAPVAHLKR